MFLFAQCQRIKIATLFWPDLCEIYAAGGELMRFPLQLCSKSGTQERGLPLGDEVGVAKLIFAGWVVGSESVSLETVRQPTSTGQSEAAAPAGTAASTSLGALRAKAPASEQLPALHVL